MTTEETNRREFEEWAKKTDSADFDLDWNDAVLNYYLWATRTAWEAWQAARERRWRPIETAPKDGTKFLAIEKDNAISVVMAGESYDGDFVWYNMEMIHVVATHWMPLPNPPTSEKI
jgi:hypothetical protein